MALGTWLKTFMTAIDATAARAAIGAGTSSVALPATATATEMRVGTQAGTRMFTPALFAEAGGTTAARPTDAGLYFRYFDTTLGKPVFLKTQPSGWVDATGTAA